MKPLARLRNFSERGDGNVSQALERAAAELYASPLSGQLAIYTSRLEGPFWINLDNVAPQKLATSSEPKPQPPDFVVFTTPGVLAAIFSGEMSPVEAFLRGKLRFSGSQQLGVAVMRQLASTQDAVFEPCRSEDG